MADSLSISIPSTGQLWLNIDSLYAKEAWYNKVVSGKKKENEDDEDEKMDTIWKSVYYDLMFSDFGEYEEIDSNDGNYVLDMIQDVLCDNLLECASKGLNTFFGMYRKMSKTDRKEVLPNIDAILVQLKYMKSSSSSKNNKLKAIEDRIKLFL